jgi:hypothetical protein
LICLLYAPFESGCSKTPIDAWIGPAGKSPDALNPAIKTGYDVKVVSLQAGDTHRFLTSNAPYRPDARCADEDLSKQYEYERELFGKRRKQVRNLANYVESLNKALSPDPSALDQAVDISAEIVKSVGAAGLNVPAATASAGAAALQKTRAYPVDAYTH